MNDMNVFMEKKKKNYHLALINVDDYRNTLGYKTRIKHFPSFHQDEPDIAFYAKVDSKARNTLAPSL